MAGNSGIAFLNPTQAVGEFSNLLSNLFQDPANMDVWFKLTAYYIAPALLIYWLVRGFLEDIRLFERYSSQIAIAITLASLPPGSYVAAWLVANYAAYSILFLFAAVLWLGLGSYYKNKLRQYNYALNSRTLTIFLAHTPFVTFLTLAGGIIGYSIGNISFLSYLSEQIFRWKNWALIIFLVIFISYYLFEYKKAQKISSSLKITILFIGIPFIFFLIIGNSKDMASVTIGAMIGYYLSLLLVWLNFQTMNPDAIIEGTKGARDMLLENYKKVNFAISGIQKMIANGGRGNRTLYQKEEKEALQHFGINPEGSYDRNTLNNMLKELKDMRTLIQSKLHQLDEQTYNSLVNTA